MPNGQPVRMMPPMQPQLSEAKRKQIEEKANEVVKALKGVPVGDIGQIFNAANQIILQKCKV